MRYIALYRVPNPTELQKFELWTKLTRSTAESFKNRPDMQDRLPVLTNDRWADAWGSEIEAFTIRGDQAL